MPTATNELYFSGIAWYYGDNDFIVRTFDFIAHSDAAHVACSTDTDSCVTCSKKIWLFANCVQLQGFPIDSHTLV